jgi:RNA polymerase-binding transcription factor DksA
MNGDGTGPVFSTGPQPLFRTEPESVAAVDLEALDSIEADLADVEHALVRLDEGTYGTCEECGRTFGGDELEDQPALRLCPEHSLVVE